MTELKGNNKSRLTINLSLFASSNDQNSNNNNCTTKSSKSPKKFEEGVVGLGIVAALNEFDHTHDPNFPTKSSKAAIFAVSPRSNPIPILSKSMKSDSVELSEEYTCVISHIGKNLIKKREYFDGELGNGSKSSNSTTTSTTSYWVSSGGVFSAASPPAATEFHAGDFLSSCYLCNKKLHGLDIFMYRGEKAFCSAECRYTQISIDEQKEKCVSGVRKQREYSVSPCSGPMQFLAGMAAA